MINQPDVWCGLCKSLHFPPICVPAGQSTLGSFRPSVKLSRPRTQSPIEAIVFVTGDEENQIRSLSKKFAQHVHNVFTERFADPLAPSILTTFLSENERRIAGAVHSFETSFGIQAERWIDAIATGFGWVSQKRQEGGHMRVDMSLSPEFYEQREILMRDYQDGARTPSKELEDSLLALAKVSPSKQPRRLIVDIMLKKDGESPLILFIKTGDQYNTNEMKSEKEKLIDARSAYPNARVFLILVKVERGDKSLITGNFQFFREDEILTGKELFQLLGVGRVDPLLILQEELEHERHE